MVVEGSDPEGTSGSLAGLEERRVWRRSLVLLAALLLAVVTVVVLLVASATRLLEQRADARSMLLARNAVAELQRSDARLALDYAWWDEAFERLHRPEPDLQWADETIGSWLSAQFGIHSSVVAWRDRDRIHAMRDHEVLDVPGVLLGAVGEALVALALGMPPDAPGPVGRFLATEYGIALATAAAVTPENHATLELDPVDRPVLVLMRFFDERLLAQLSDIYGLDDLHLRSESVEHSIALGNDGERPFAWLAWRPLRHGAEVLPDLVRPSIAALLFLGAVLAMIFWWIRQSARRLDESLVALAERERTAIALRGEAEQANRLRSVFLANVNHELRTPLNAVIGFSEILRDQHLGSDDHPSYRQYAADIHASGRRLLAMIDGIVEISSIEAGLVRPSARLVELGALLRQICAEVAACYPDVGPERLLLSVAEAELTAEIDSELLTQTLRRLVEHCLEESDRVVTVSLQLGGSGRFQVRVGESALSPEAARRLFEPFGQGENPLVNERGQGSLRLALARALARLLAGRLEVQAGSEGRASFLLCLPLRPSSSSDRPAPMLERSPALA